MRQAVLFETLHFLTRDDLDACQLASSFWSNTIVRAAKTLTLCYIQIVQLKECIAGKYVSVELADEGDYYQHQDRFINRYEPLVPADDYADLLRLFDHSFVNELTSCSFCGGFLDYWLRCNEEISCRIGKFRPTRYCPAVNYDDCLRRVHLVMNTLQPSMYCAAVRSGQPCFMLGLEMVCDAVPGLEVYLATKNTFADLRDNVDAYMFDNLNGWIFRASRLERCDIVFNSRPDPALTEWISSVVERFENTGDIVRSLSIIWMLHDVVGESNPPAIRRLQASSSTVAKPSRNDFVAEFCRHWDCDEYAETPAHLLTFRNDMRGKVLNVHKWIVTVGGKMDCIALLFETADSP
ncbi:hypothetical protein AAVH_22088 [Aphelenchoides avenae]|nr:hypothetical protein AAVH_22088 [Aphelenchus avenae]